MREPQQPAPSTAPVPQTNGLAVAGLDLGYRFEVVTDVRIRPDRVEYLDLLLDVRVMPDGGVRVKDEEEVEEAPAGGLRVGSAQAAVRTASERRSFSSASRSIVRTRSADIPSSRPASRSDRDPRPSNPKRSAMICRS
jgi:hypothetical protein